MNIGIVGIDGRKDYVEAMAEFIAVEVRDDDTVYTIDKGEFHQEVWQVCKGLGQPVVVMRSDTTIHGIQANMKRDIELAKAVDKVVCFWDFRDPDVSLVITMTKLWGKLIHVNPHENGGIIADKKLKAEDFRDVAEQANAECSNHSTPEGSNPPVPTITKGICGFDDGCDG